MDKWLIRIGLAVLLIERVWYYAVVLKAENNMLDFILDNILTLTR